MGEPQEAGVEGVVLRYVDMFLAKISEFAVKGQVHTKLYILCK